MFILFKRFILIILSPKSAWIFILYEVKKNIFDLVHLFKKKYKYKIIFIAGMPMSATTKVKNMCGMIPGYFTRYSPIPRNIAVKQDISESVFRYTPGWSYTLFKTHLNPNLNNLDIVKKNNVKKIVVTYRDLRDVAIARYHRLIKFPKKKSDPHYSEYHLMNKSNAINDSISVVAKDYIKWINGWLNISKENKDFVLFIKFEDLINDPKNEFKRILNFYEINLNEELINHICKSTEGKKDMVTNLNDAKVLPWAISSNFRSGKIGNWKNEFTEENLVNAKKLLGKSLIDLKYEDDLNWTL